MCAICATFLPQRVSSEAASLLRYIVLPCSCSVGARINLLGKKSSSKRQRSARKSELARARPSSGWEALTSLSPLAIKPPLPPLAPRAHTHAPLSSSLMPSLRSMTVLAAASAVAGFSPTPLCVSSRAARAPMPLHVLMGDVTGEERAIEIPDALVKEVRGMKAMVDEVEMLGYL